MVGVAGFEPTTSRPPDVRATKLRYTPILEKKRENDCGNKAIPKSLVPNLPSFVSSKVRENSRSVRLHTCVGAPIS